MSCRCASSCQSRGGPARAFRDYLSRPQFSRAWAPLHDVRNDLLLHHGLSTASNRGHTRANRSMAIPRHP
jgi:hypothetical protein